MTRDKISDIRQRLQCASGHLNAVLTMVEKESPCEEVLHQLHAVEAALKMIGQILVLSRVEEIESLIKDSSTSEESTAQFRRFAPLYSIAQSYSYLPNDEENS
jgi:DNA-binding FrmR family transcriptional regulator